MKVKTNQFDAINEESKYSNEEESKNIDNEEISVSISEDNGPKQCRICLDEENTFGNPLISPCKCSGTMKYIHYTCLTEWLENKLINVVEENCIKYAWK
jgi:E3 ubiquitin-protein ligase DOA10